VSTWSVIRLDELERLPVDDEGLLWRPLRRTLGVQAFGVNAWTAANAGERVIERHREPEGPEELYVVLEGRATFTVGAEDVDAPAGTFVFVPPGTERGAIAAEPSTTVVAVGARQGEAFTPSAWEEWYLADGLRRAGRLDEGRAQLRATIEARPDSWHPAYNAACFESLAGGRDAAFDHLRRAVEMGGDEARNAARGDSDFDALREDPRFEEALA
jgi:quercetin dioxygenase-like cupin family protein